VSIGSVQSNPMVNPWTESVAPRSGSTTAWNAASNMSCDPQSGTTAAASNPFQNLASDLQAMLIQAQGSATTTATASATSAAGGTTGTTLEQQLATDLQSMMNDLQGTASTSTQTAATQTASANPADPTGQAQPHHHHHHHGGGDEASGATAVASTPPGTTATSADDEATAQIFAGDITQALAAYGGGMSSSMMPAPMV
jgi:hypothetical protein